MCVLRERELFRDPDMSVWARRYAPATVFAPHQDDFSRVTLTLWGSVAEDTRHGAAVIGVGDVLLKSRSAVHENRYAPEGAIHVSFEFLSEDGDRALQRVLDDVWSVRRGAGALRHATAALEAAVANDTGAVHAATLDMTAAIADTPARRTAAPPWLKTLKTELEQRGLAGVDVGSRAREVGIHPVHLSRLFRTCYGASITDHAQFHAVRRALGELVTGASLSAAAASAGFYDQSHMSRVFRRVTGRTPGKHRAIWAAAVR